MNKLLLIRGLGHSGTTILDLALGAHPQMVGLGEAARILARPAPSDAHRGVVPVVRSPLIARSGDLFWPGSLSTMTAPWRSK